MSYGVVSTALAIQAGGPKVDELLIDRACDAVGAPGLKWQGHLDFPSLSIVVILPLSTKLSVAQQLEAHCRTQWPPGVAMYFFTGVVPAGWFFPPVGVPAPAKQATDTEPPAPKTTEERIAEDREDGMNCYRCGEWFFMAEPNTPDGKLECYRCRQDPWRAGTVPRTE